MQSYIQTVTLAQSNFRYQIKLNLSANEFNNFLDLCRDAYDPSQPASENTDLLNHLKTNISEKNSKHSKLNFMSEQNIWLN